MADLQSIANVSISLNSSGVSRAGFGTPLFETAFNYATTAPSVDSDGNETAPGSVDRVSSYSSLSDVSSVFPTDSNAYAAAESVFSNDPSVDTFKIGRIKASSTIAIDGDWSAATTYTVTVSTYWDDIDTDTDTWTVEASSVGEASETATIGVLYTAINDALGAAGNTSLIITNLSDTLRIDYGTALTGSDFYLSDISGLQVTASADINRETLLEAYNEIILVDNDFYAISTEVHDDTYIDSGSTGLSEILELADTIEADDKIYFVGSQATSSIDTTYTSGDTPASDDILGNLIDQNYSRSIGWWIDTANDDFSELAFAGYNLPFDAGSIVWGNIQVPTSNAKNTAGNALTTTQEQNLSDRNANWPSIKGGIVYAREGKVASGEWIDVIRGRDNLKSDLEADLFDTLTNQQGQKIPYTDKGINVIAGIVETRLNDYKVNRNFLTDPIKITVPKAADITRDVKVTRILEDMSFTATLAGAIMLVDLTGTLEV